MQRKLLLCLVFSTLVFFLSAKSKYYEDRTLGFKGEAGATYVTRDFEGSPDDFSDIAYENLTSLADELELEYRVINKLTKEEGFLLWEALGEYDYEDDEVYSVVIFTNNRCLYLHVRIHSNRQSLQFVCIEPINE